MTSKTMLAEETSAILVEIGIAYQRFERNGMPW